MSKRQQKFEVGEVVYLFTTTSDRVFRCRVVAVSSYDKHKYRLEADSEPRDWLWMYGGKWIYESEIFRKHEVEAEIERRHRSALDSFLGLVSEEKKQ